MNDTTSNDLTHWDTGNHRRCAALQNEFVDSERWYVGWDSTLLAGSERVLSLDSSAISKTRLEPSDRVT